MYILLKTDEPEKIKITNGQNKSHYFYAENLTEAKMYLEELEDTNNFEYWSKYYVNPHFKCCEDFNKYLRQTVLETNKLSRKEIDDLCYEYLEFAQVKTKKNPEIIISHDAIISSLLNHGKGFKFEAEREKLSYIINKYTQTKNNIYDNYLGDNEINPVKDLKLILPIKQGVVFHNCACGALNMNFYKIMYYIDFLDIHIPDRNLRNFWKFYKKAMGIYALQYNYEHNRFYVIPKPDELYIKNDITHCSYGELDHYCDGVKVPYWLYDSEPEDLDIKDFEKIKNIDHRSIFIKKIGISKFIDRGEVIDSWENYPDNEWWAKSEYKLVDMKDFFVEKRIMRGKKEIGYENYKYAPFLCMKNQTTGEYHLEGVSPKCKNLYDALKMRYKGLNLPVYDIKDIK